MFPVARSPCLPALQSPSARELEELLATARALQREAATRKPPQPLSGKHLGLLRESRAGDEEAALFHAAASALGAQVAEVHPGLDDASSARQVRHTARLLGRLYVAIECQGLSARLVSQLAAEAGVPVYDGLASRQHPTARLAGRLDPDRTPDDRRRLVVQAVLSSLP